VDIIFVRPRLPNLPPLVQDSMLFFRNFIIYPLKAFHCYLD